MNRVYLDNAASTKVDKDIIEEVVKFYDIDYANPSSIHKDGRRVRASIDKARSQVAKLINTNDENIIFTSGATESDNWAIIKIMQNNSKKSKHMITSVIEHPAILSSCAYLEKQGYEVTYLGVDKNGIVSVEELKKHIRKDTALVSIMAVNNEIGTIQPISQIAEIAHQYGAYFHTDAVQAIGKIDIDVKDMNIDFMSMSGHKIHALKGIGAFYAKDPKHIDIMMHGGGQENEKRGGTENVAGIVSMGLACEKLIGNYAQREQIKQLRDYLIDEVLKKVDRVILSGDREKRACNNVNFCFADVDSRLMLVLLDKANISASIGSACSAGDIKLSHVIEALDIDDKYKSGNIRLTLSKYTTKEEIDYTVETIQKVVEKIRM